MAKLLQVVPFPCTLVGWAGVEQLFGLFDVAGRYLSFGQGDVAEVKITFRQLSLASFCLCRLLREPSLHLLFLSGLSGIFQSLPQTDAIGQGHRYGDD